MDTTAEYMSTLPHLATYTLNANLKVGEMGWECSMTERYEKCKVIIGTTEGKRLIGKTYKWRKIPNPILRK
jgi:hypothetical protein